MIIAEKVINVYAHEHMVVALLIARDKEEVKREIKERCSYEPPNEFIFDTGIPAYPPEYDRKGVYKFFIVRWIYDSSG